MSPADACRHVPTDFLPGVGPAASPRPDVPALVPPMLQPWTFCLPSRPEPSAAAADDPWPGFLGAEPPSSIGDDAGWRAFLRGGPACR